MISLLVTAQATLRVIGLATVMQGSPGIDVVMPPVPNQEAIHIERHVPILIVRNNELVGPTDGWITKPFSDGFTYVDLTGEDVQFLPDVANGPAQVPPELPRLTNGCQFTGLVIRDPTGGGIPDVGFPQPQLLDSYRPPIYKAAAAVLRVPYGSTSVCRAFVKEQKRTRLDTNVVWNTRGVTIVGKYRENRLRLAGYRVLIVAGNVPSSLLERSTTTHSHFDAGHFKAYYTMLVPEWRDSCTRQAPTVHIRRCPESTRALQAVAPSPIPGVMSILTSECSNTQYP